MLGITRSVRTTWSGAYCGKLTRWNDFGIAHNRAEQCGNVRKMSNGSFVNYFFGHTHKSCLQKAALYFPAPQATAFFKRVWKAGRP